MKKLSIIIALLLLGFLADYFFLHKLFPLKQQAALQELNAEVTKVLNRSPNAPSQFPNGTSPANAQIVSNNVAEEFSRCVVDSANPGLPSDLNPDSTDRILQELRNQNLVKLETSLITNIHVKTDKGEIKRIHIIADDSAEHSKIAEVRLFSEDKEGLPVPIPLPPAKAKNPKPEYLLELQKMGNIVMSHQKKHLALKDGSQVLFDTINGKAQDFQWILKKGSLNCHFTQCLCRSN